MTDKENVSSIYSLVMYLLHIGLNIRKKEERERKER